MPKKSITPQRSKEESEDTFSYNGWLNSDKFLKRAFAIYGYSMVAGLIVAFPFYILLIIIFFLIR